MRDYNLKQEAYLILAVAEWIGTETIEIIESSFPEMESHDYSPERYISELELIDKKSKIRIKEAISKIDCVKRIIDDEGIRFITCVDDDFPEKLRYIPDSPRWLFVKGNLPDPEKPGVAVVGARKCTRYGTDTAQMFARELSKRGVEIISGLAYGIDGAAHEGALEAGGKTYGVLGCGVDVVYPLSNKKLFLRMCEQGGIISEYPPGATPAAVNFPRRNRIISGLSDAVLVTQAQKASGSMITVRHALDQGRDVFAVPGNIYEVLSSGCNNLIKEGAFPALSPIDIVNVLAEQYIVLKLFEDTEKRRKATADTVSNERKFAANLDSNERKVLKHLTSQPMHIDELVYETSMSVSEVRSVLTSLISKNLTKEDEFNTYVKCSELF